MQNKFQGSNKIRIFGLFSATLMLFMCSLVIFPDLVGALTCLLISLYTVLPISMQFVVLLPETKKITSDWLTQISVYPSDIWIVYM